MTEFLIFVGILGLSVVVGTAFLILGIVVFCEILNWLERDDYYGSE